MMRSLDLPSCLPFDILIAFGRNYDGLSTVC